MGETATLYLNKETQNYIEYRRKTCAVNHPLQIIHRDSNGVGNALREEYTSISYQNEVKLH